MQTSISSIKYIAAFSLFNESFACFFAAPQIIIHIEQQTMSVLNTFLDVSDSRETLACITKCLGLEILRYRI